MWLLVMAALQVLCGRRSDLGAGVGAGFPHGEKLPAHLPASHEAHLIGNSTPRCAVTSQVLSGLGVRPPHPCAVTCLPGQNQLTDRGTTQRQHPVVFWALVLPRACPPSPKSYNSIHSSRLEWVGTQSTSSKDERSYLFSQC